jgi:glutathione synthase/RimK-type ligase-like ATP-grasp enzyme
LANEPLLCQFVDEIEEVPISKEITDLRSFLTDRLRTCSLNYSFANKRVLILTNKLDIEADLVGIGLLRRGIDYTRLNIDDILTQQIRLTYSLDNEYNSRIELTTGVETQDIKKLKVVWLRHFDTDEVNFDGKELTNVFSLQQWNHALHTLQNNLAACQWIDKPDAILTAGNRWKQLSIAKRMGFHIPATLITNDPMAARKFYTEHDGDIVLKALHHHGIVIKGRRYSIYTRPWTNENVSRFDDLIYAPCIIQERLHKKSDLRVTVVGDEVFAVELDSQSTRMGKDDWHRSDISSIPKRIVRLDDLVGQLCIKLIKLLELKYGAIDLVNTEEGEVMFLEINPTGDWYWIERFTGLRITEAVVDLIEKLTKE